MPAICMGWGLMQLRQRNSGNSHRSKLSNSFIYLKITPYYVIWRYTMRYLQTFSAFSTSDPLSFLDGPYRQRECPVLLSILCQLSIAPPICSPFCFPQINNTASSPSWPLHEHLWPIFPTALGPSFTDSVGGTISPTHLVASLFLTCKCRCLTGFYNLLSYFVSALPLWA